LSKETDFPRQISSWLLSIGFDCEPDKSAQETFWKVQVKKSGRLLLELKLIEPESWDDETSITEVHSYKIRQSGLRKSGVHSVLLWQDHWESRREIVKSRIQSLLGISHRIPARLTKVFRIDKMTAHAFLEKNHLQGHVLSKFQFGLYLPKQYFRVLPADYQLDIEAEHLLVAVATFSRPRLFPREDKPFRSYELIRFANTLDITVVGGLNKLLSAFSKEIKPDDIMTYVDLEWSDGEGYAKLGFEEISEKPPIAFMLDTQTNERFSLRNSGDNEHLVKITNGGSLKFVKTIEKKSYGS